MNEDIRRGGRTSDPSDRTAGPDFAAGNRSQRPGSPRETDDGYVGVIAVSQGEAH